jgi:cytosine/adenosine deaminase-related metal-dependent hydrolase
VYHVPSGSLRRVDTIRATSAATVLSDGVVYIGDDGRIAAVAPASAPAPAGFGAVTPVKSGGVIYPGLIDLHNHLPYNTIGLWADDKRKTPWSDHDQWTRAGTYGPAVSHPGAFLGWVSAPSLIAYVEMKAIVGGTTTVQGNGKVNHSVDGSVARNIDTERFGTKKDFFRVGTLVQSHAADLVPIAQAMVSKGAGFIYHVAEGVDPKLVKEWNIANDGGVVRKGFVAIHGTALGAEQFGELAAVGASLVWSPFSNMWLYGGTVDIAAAKAAGVRFCLGSDWAPSGTKHVLGELKVAELCNKAPAAWRQPPTAATTAGPVFTDLELCRMVTSNPGDAIASVAGAQVGRLQAGWLADVVVMRKRRVDPYRNLIVATEKDVRLVLVGGEARYGMASLMTAAGATNAAPLTVGGRARQAVIRSPQNRDKFFAFADVVARLEEVRAHPEVAAREVALALASVGGDLDDPRAPLVVIGDMPLPNGGGQWTAGRNDPPTPCPIPELQSLVHDTPWFDALDQHTFHRGLLSPLRAYYA